jgi:hypothetical protein
MVDHIDDDPEAKLYQRLSERYQGKAKTPPGPGAERRGGAPYWVWDLDLMGSQKRSP